MATAARVEHVLEEEVGERLQSDDAHENEQPRAHEPEEVSVATGAHLEGPEGHLREVQLEPGRGARIVGYERHRQHHGHQQHRGHRIEGQVVAAVAREDADDHEADECSEQIAEPVKRSGLAQVRLRDDVGEETLIRALRGVGGELEEEIHREQPEVAAHECHQHEEECRAHGPARDVRPSPPPGERGSVGQRADHRLPEDGNQGTGALEDGQRRPLVGLADEPAD